MRILVTGSMGMIGKCLVKSLVDEGYEVIGLDKVGDSFKDGSYFYQVVDLDNKEALKKIINKYHVNRIIHLAALAHETRRDYSTWDNYKHINVECAKNVFQIAGDIPVLFISTVDVFGFNNGKRVTTETKIHPVTFYGKSKAMAESECKKIKYYDIFRFSPVYTDSIKRDIQKRYYLKYPLIAYQIGNGKEYEVLNVKKAVSEMTDWCKLKPSNSIKIIKDEKNMSTLECIKLEKMEDRAKIVLYFPDWMINVAYRIIKGITGENKFTYLLNKAVSPLRSD